MLVEQIGIVDSIVKELKENAQPDFLSNPYVLLRWLVLSTPPMNLL